MSNECREVTVLAVDERMAILRVVWRLSQSSRGEKLAEQCSMSWGPIVG
jgi:hypothetical protein